MLYQQSFAIESRLASLVALIRAGGLSTPELADRLEVSVPTVSRGIAALRNRGYVIESHRQSGGWGYHLLGEPGNGPGKREAVAT